MAIPFRRGCEAVCGYGVVILGLANAGVLWFGSSAWDQNSWAVFLGLGIGKTLGIAAMTIAGYPLLRLVARRRAIPVKVESGDFVRWNDIPLIGMLGAMGFTVALFVADAAGAGDSLKLGAMASFGYLGVAIICGRWIVPRSHRSVTTSDSVGIPPGLETDDPHHPTSKFRRSV